MLIFFSSFFFILTVIYNDVNIMLVVKTETGIFPMKLSLK